VFFPKGSELNVTRTRRWGTLLAVKRGTDGPYVLARFRGRKMRLDTDPGTATRLALLIKTFPDSDIPITNDWTEA
jgi:hypothetical protein